MKSHISATIDEKLVEALNEYGQQERRSRSQVIELALEEFLRGKLKRECEWVTSGGSFGGNFSREETYAR